MTLTLALCLALACKAQQSDLVCHPNSASSCGIPATYPDRMDAKPIVLHHVIRHPFEVWDFGDGEGVCRYTGGLNEILTICPASPPAKHHSAAPQPHHTHKPRKHGNAK